jgi:hypothetical protein
VWRLEPGVHRLEVVAELFGGGELRAESTYEVRTR